MNQNYNSINNDIEQGQSSSFNTDSKIQPLRDHIVEVTNIMKENVTKILEKGAKLDNIENRSDRLSSMANEFCINSNRVRKKMWWQNFRTNIILIVFLITFIIIIYFLVS